MKRRKTQFSQKICLFAMALVCAELAGNFILAWFGKQTLSDVAIAVIGTFGGFVTCGYFALSGARNCSQNKYGGNALHEDAESQENDGIHTYPEDRFYS